MSAQFEERLRKYDEDFTRTHDHLDDLTPAAEALHDARTNTSATVG